MDEVGWGGVEEREASSSIPRRVNWEVTMRLGSEAFFLDSAQASAQKSQPPPGHLAISQPGREAPPAQRLSSGQRAKPQGRRRQQHHHQHLVRCSAATTAPQPLWEVATRYGHAQTRDKRCKASEPKAVHLPPPKPESTTSTRPSQRLGMLTVSLESEHALVFSQTGPPEPGHAPVTRTP